MAPQRAVLRLLAQGHLLVPATRPPDHLIRARIRLAVLQAHGVHEEDLTLVGSSVELDVDDAVEDPEVLPSATALLLVDVDGRRTARTALVDQRCGIRVRPSSQPPALQQDP